MFSKTEEVQVLRARESSAKIGKIFQKFGTISKEYQLPIVNATCVQMFMSLVALAL